VAAGWASQRERFQAVAMPVSQWLVEAIEPQPGHRLLELAAGPGDTGFLAAELIAPGGELICSDGSEAMLDVARARAAELGLAGVEFRLIDAEWIDLPTASLDGVLCRWGYMLLADPVASLRETRRVLRPGGRVALAAWADAGANPWMSAMTRVMLDQGLIDPPDPSVPGPLSWADPLRIEHALEDAGFVQPRIDQVGFEISLESFDAMWAFREETSPKFSSLLAALNERQTEALRAGAREALEPYGDDAGGYRFGALTHVATAEA
jgi:SAM-dependent methyltransferase